MEARAHGLTVAYALDALDADERRLFDELLDAPDNDLLDMALGRREPEPRYRAVVEMLRAA